jgi:hypothetical protein
VDVKECDMEFAILLSKALLVIAHIDICVTVKNCHIKGKKAHKKGSK